MPHTTLYRPVGLYELKLIADTDYQAFPPRLPEQPIFYPVLNFEYAAQIAKDWNTKDSKSGYMGAVTRFVLSDSYLNQFEVQVVGGTMHQELWIPADELENFNAHVIGQIEVAATYYGAQYSGEQDW